MDALQIAKQLYDKHGGKNIETGGPNKGAELVDLLTQSNGKTAAGWTPGQSWCAATVSKIAWEADHGAGTYPNDLPEFPYGLSSQAIMRYFESLGRLTSDWNDLKHMTGAVGGFTDHPDTAHGHVFFIARRLTDASGNVVGINTYEGNSNTDGSANGNGYYQRERTIGQRTLWFCDCSAIPGFAYWPKMG